MLNSVKAMMGGKGFRQPKKLTNKQRAEREAGQAFLADYRDVCDRHGKKLDIVWDFDKENGPRALLAIVNHTPATRPQIKNWSKAMRENLEVRSNCKHREGEHNACADCALPKVHWHESGTGVTDEYKATQMADIEEQEVKDIAESGGRMSAE